MIHVERRPDGVAIVWLDHPEKPVNTLSPAVVEEFNEKVAPLLDDDDVRAMVVVSAKTGHLHRRRRSRGHRGSRRSRDQQHVARGQRPARAHLHRPETGGGGGPRRGPRRRARGGAGLPLHPRHRRPEDGARPVRGHARSAAGGRRHPAVGRAGRVWWRRCRCCSPANGCARGGPRRWVWSMRSRRRAASPRPARGRRWRWRTGTLKRRPRKKSLMDRLAATAARPGDRPAQGAPSRWHGRPGGSTRRRRRSSTASKPVSRRAASRVWRRERLLRQAAP